MQNEEAIEPQKEPGASVVKRRHARPLELDSDEEEEQEEEEEEVKNSGNVEEQEESKKTNISNTDEV